MHGPLVLFVVQAIFIILLARLLGVVARKLGQPLVIAEIVAGILLGPSLLGWLWPNVKEALFPASSMPVLGLLSQVGLVLFMFLIGLELDPKLLKGKTHSSVAISHSSIVVPFALGAMLAFKIHGTLAPEGVKFTSFMLFMGAAMSITAFPVLARILVERRLLRTRIGAVTIACAAVDDVTAWCILAFVVSVARSASPLEALRTTVLSLVYIGVMLKLARPLMIRWAERTGPGLTQNRIAAILLLLLASSLVTEWIGIHALFGAFLFGAILPKEGGFAAALAEKLEDLVVVLLLPLFFAYSGLRTQIGLLNSTENFVVCAWIIVLACVGKFGGSAVAARLTGMSWRESSAIGVLMNTRGLMELIVLNIGLDLGVISPTLFTMMVVMALVTTFVTTPLLQKIYPAEELARELAEDEARQSAAASTARHYTALVCVSFERAARGLTTLAVAIAGTKAERARIYALRLLRPTNRASFVLEQQSSSIAGGDDGPRRDVALSPCLERAGELGARIRPLSFVSDAPAKDICGVAEVKHADIVLLGWHKPFLGSSMLTGTVHDVMESATQDIGVFVDRGLEAVGRILVPYLGGDNDRAALRIARRIAENTGAKVTILHVVPPVRESEPLGAEDLVREEFRETSQERGYTVDFRVLPHASPGDAVIEACRTGDHDLMLIGLGPSWNLEHRAFGMQAERILEHSPLSVLVVRASTAPSEAPAMAASSATLESAPAEPA